LGQGFWILGVGVRVLNYGFEVVRHKLALRKLAAQRSTVLLGTGDRTVYPKP